MAGPNLTREQRRVLDALIAESRVVPKPLRPLARRAAVQTGLVESNLRELGYGDADSQNWRQERETFYGDDWARSGGPNNTRASARRFYREFMQHYDRGERAYEVAAQVQRPAAQYRDRYRQVRHQAEAILDAYRGAAGGGGGGGGRARGRRGGGSALIDRGVTAGRQLPGGGADMAALLTALSQQRPQVASGSLPTPAFSAAPAMPAGAQLPSGGGGPAPPGPDISTLLEAVRTVGGGTTPQAGVEGSVTSIPGSGRGQGRVRRRGARAPVGQVDFTPRGDWAGTKGPIEDIEQLAAKVHGLTSTGKRPTRNTASGNVSDHYIGNKIATARDISGPVPRMDAAAVDIARALGIKGYRRGQPLETSVVRNGVRYQVLYRTNTGGNHFDHIHVGAKRVGR